MGLRNTGIAGYRSVGISFCREFGIANIFFGILKKEAGILQQNPSLRRDNTTKSTIQTSMVCGTMNDALVIINNKPRAKGYS